MTRTRIETVYPFCSCERCGHLWSEADDSSLSYRTRLDFHDNEFGRFFKLYLYTAIAPVPLSAFAGELNQSVDKIFIPPAVNPDAAAVTMVWSYVGELIFNMLILVGAVKMADRVVREIIGL